MASGSSIAAKRDRDRDDAKGLRDLGERAREPGAPSGFIE
jgi:hypothetical protein